MDTLDTINYRGYTINIHYDDSPECPWVAWDCEPPLLAVHLPPGSRNVHNHGLDRTPPTLTREQIKQHASDITTALDSRTLLHAVKDLLPYYLHTYSTATDAVNDAIGEYAESISNGSDLTAFLAQCWTWAGCIALDTSTSGYSQRDYADLLLVATPEWLETTGIKPEHALKQLEASAELYGDWCWGNVYGYTITGPDDEETNDSCWGFYGDDHRTSGLLEYAEDAVDCEIRRRRKQHLARLKTYITHRVPLHARTY
jgi:hypothetical protein